MSALQKLEINDVFAACRFVKGSGGQYRAPEGWYPVLGLPGSLDIEAHAVLFCKLQGPVEARVQASCLNGVIGKIRIHRSARVKGPDSMLVLASDLLHEFEVCQVPILPDATQLAVALPAPQARGIAGDRHDQR